MLKTEQYYEKVLQAHYNNHYKKYDEETEYFVNPAVNKWKFRIPSLNTVFTLVCDDGGKITEYKRYYEDERVWYSIELTKGTAEKLKRYLWENDIQFEPSECYNLTHFECYMTEAECESMNKFLEEVIFADQEED